MGREKRREERERSPKTDEVLSVCVRAGEQRRVLAFPARCVHLNGIHSRKGRERRGKGEGGGRESASLLFCSPRAPSLLLSPSCTCCLSLAASFQRCLEETPFNEGNTAGGRDNPNPPPNPSSPPSPPKRVDACVCTHAALPRVKREERPSAGRGVILIIIRADAYRGLFTPGVVDRLPFLRTHKHTKRER